jgi:hypothetical protein
MYVEESQRERESIAAQSSQSSLAKLVLGGDFQFGHTAFKIAKFLHDKKAIPYPYQKQHPYQDYDRREVLLCCLPRFSRTQRDRY